MWKGQSPDNKKPSSLWVFFPNHNNYYCVEKNILMFYVNVTGLGIDMLHTI